MAQAQSPMLVNALLAECGVDAVVVPVHGGPPGGATAFRVRTRRCYT